MRIEVVRSGGFAGLTRQAALTVEPADPDWPALRTLVDQCGLGPDGFDYPGAARPDPTSPGADRFTFAFTVDGRELVVGEDALRGPYAALAGRVLGDKLFS